MRGQPKRDWKDARAKVEAEGRCRVCGGGNLSSNVVEAAHVIGRDRDKDSGYKVLPERIVPLCRFVSGNGCHPLFDEHQLDLWHLLTFEEQAQAIEDAGGYWLAVKRCSPLAYKAFNERSAA